MCSLAHWCLQVYARKHHQGKSPCQENLWSSLWERQRRFGPASIFAPLSRHASCPNRKEACCQGKWRPWARAGSSELGSPMQSKGRFMQRLLTIIVWSMLGRMKECSHYWWLHWYWRIIGLQWAALLTYFDWLLGWPCNTTMSFATIWWSSSIWFMTTSWWQKHDWNQNHVKAEVPE